LLGLITVILAVIGGVAAYPSSRPFLAERFGSIFGSQHPDLIVHKVRSEYLQVAVVERGTLESAVNMELVCKVKAGSKGTFASSIRWVIDDGTIVTKGQLLMELDDSSLQEQFRTQAIAVEKAKAEWVKADEEYTIQFKQNESDIVKAAAALKVAELDLDKYLGIRLDDSLNPTGAVVGCFGTLVERGEYQAKLDDLSSQLKLAESDMEAFRDRAAWASRSVRLGFLTPSQAKVEQSKLESSMDKAEKLANDKYVLEMFMRERELTNLKGLLEVARLELERVQKQADSKLNQAESTRRTAYSVYMQEVERLREMEDQIRECKIHAPQDGMVVYYKEPSRWSNTNEGMIQVGAQVKEGQKLMRIPDLKRMQVNTKVHEALVNRIRGDDRQSTGFFDSVRAGLLAMPEPFTRLVAHSEYAQGVIREKYRDREYYLASQGQKARIRVDAIPSRVFDGHVRSVAAVSSQQDWSSADVKVYQTLVTIDEEVVGLKPDMSAEVTIIVDPPTEPVLAVPLQSVVGGTEGGSKRKVYVMTPSGPQEREVVLGMFNEKMVEVREGLSEGEDVVLNPKVILGDKAKTREDTAESGGRRMPGNVKGGSYKSDGEGKGRGGKGGMGGNKSGAGSPTGFPKQ
jgi:multidrug efflux pump subunit AcrA (membrane-fusion protein)